MTKLYDVLKDCKKEEEILSLNKVVGVLLVGIIAVCPVL